MVEVGLVHRFVTIIGHHPPDGRSYASGMVSPVKKPGSPPNGSVVSGFGFEENVANQYEFADRGRWHDTYQQLRRVGWNRDVRVNPPRLIVCDAGLVQDGEPVADARIDAEECGGASRIAGCVNVIHAGLWKIGSRKLVLRVYVTTATGRGTQPPEAADGRKIHSALSRYALENGVSHIRVGEKINPLHDSPCRDCRAHPAGSVSWPPRVGWSGLRFAC